MKQLALFGLCAIAVAIAGSAALLAIQNASPASLSLFGYESIRLPLGLLLTGCAGLGAIVAAVMLAFGGKRR
ncbi:MAG: DUF1049 domain-containing protein [Geitlerinemataceae cyanobacterium]